MARIKSLRNYPFLKSGKRIRGPHMIHTEAETLDEALTIIRSSQRVPRLKKAPTLRQQFAVNQAQQTWKPITLSTGVVVPKRKGPNTLTPRKPDVVWTHAEIIAAHATGSFKWKELAHRAKVPVRQIIFWLYGADRPPIRWVCQLCRADNFNKEACCKNCNKPWYSGLTGAPQ